MRLADQCQSFRFIFTVQEGTDPSVILSGTKRCCKHENQSPSSSTQSGAPALRVSDRTRATMVTQLALTDRDLHSTSPTNHSGLRTKLFTFYHENSGGVD